MCDADLALQIILFKELLICRYEFLLHVLLLRFRFESAKLQRSGYIDDLFFLSNSEVHLALWDRASDVSRYYVLIDG